MSNEFPYSTWLVPQPPLFEEIQTDIAKISTECTTPNFPAHLTLVPDFLTDEDTIVNTITEIAKKYKPFSIEFTAVGHSETDYWKSLYLHVKPTQELVDLRSELLFRYGREVTPFMPHVSIMYSNHKENTTKETLRKKYHLDRFNGRTWEVDRIFIYLTRQEDVHTGGWKKIAEIPLKGM